MGRTLLLVSDVPTRIWGALQCLFIGFHIILFVRKPRFLVAVRIFNPPTSMSVKSSMMSRSRLGRSSHGCHGAPTEAQTHHPKCYKARIPEN